MLHVSLGSSLKPSIPPLRCDSPRLNERNGNSGKMNTADAQGNSAWDLVSKFVHCDDFSQFTSPIQVIAPLPVLLGRSSRTVGSSRPDGTLALKSTYLLLRVSAEFTEDLQ
jgi:hypothetical protein